MAATTRRAPAGRSPSPISSPSCPAAPRTQAAAASHCSSRTPCRTPPSRCQCWCSRPHAAAGAPPRLPATHGPQRRRTPPRRPAALAYVISGGEGDVGLYSLCCLCRASSALRTSVWSRPTTRSSFASPSYPRDPLARLGANKINGTLLDPAWPRSNRIKNLSSWWRLYGTEVPALQKMATRILSLTSSASGCERNWSGFEAIHTKRRNRLTTTRLNKLVYIQFNSKLLNRREKIKSKKINDVLLSNETTEVQGFLHENGDDCALVVYRDEEEEEEMEGTGIPWSVLGDAVGAEEQLQLRRSARVRELYEGEEFESDKEEFDEDEDDYLEPY